MDERVRINNERMAWENKLGRQLAHKAVDEPLLDEEDMGINANRTTTISGMGWKELAVIGALIAGSGVAAAYFAGGEKETIDNPAPTPVTQEPDPSKLVVPGIRFGPSS